MNQKEITQTMALALVFIAGGIACFITLYIISPGLQEFLSNLFQNILQVITGFNLGKWALGVIGMFLTMFGISYFFVLLNNKSSKDKKENNSQD